jgi:hypothetical protein
MIKVYTPSVIGAPAHRVWARIRDFNGLPAWNPVVADSRIEENLAPDRVGCIRQLHTKDGGAIASNS